MKVIIEIKKTDHFKKPDGGILRRMMEKPIPYSLWTVHTFLKLSEEERAIAKTTLLFDKVLFTKVHQSEHFEMMTQDERNMLSGHRSYDYTVADVLRDYPFETYFYDPVSAQKFAHEMEAEILPRLKTYLTASATPHTKQQFEL